MVHFMDDLRRLLDQSDSSRYAISKQTGIEQGSLSRFVHHQHELSARHAETLADHLGHRIVLEPKQPTLRSKGR